MIRGPYALVGAGGHGREVLQVLQRANISISGVYDDRDGTASLVTKLGVRFLGPVSYCTDPAYIGIGTGRARQLLDARLKSAPAVVDPSAVVGEDVVLGAGCIIFALSTVTTNITVGRHVHVGRGAAIGHDCEIADYVSIMPLAGIAGNVVIEEAAYIGAGAMIRQGIRIGRQATVGMGAVVVTDVQPGVTVVGSPARPIDPK